MKFAISPWDCPSVPVAGGAERYPVRHIYCVGRNYAEHAKEMGGDAAKEPPFFFTKPADAIVPVVPPDTGHVQYPLATKNYHHEIELVVAIGAAGVRVAPERANALIYGYAVGLDMVRSCGMKSSLSCWSFFSSEPIRCGKRSRSFCSGCSTSSSRRRRTSSTASGKTVSG